MSVSSITQIGPSRASGQPAAEVLSIDRLEAHCAGANLRAGGRCAGLNARDLSIALQTWIFGIGREHTRGSRSSASSSRFSTDRMKP
jgi:hypothetical protein